MTLVVIAALFLARDLMLRRRARRRRQAEREFNAVMDRIEARVKRLKETLR